MDPVIDNEWLTCKNDPVEEPQAVGNIVRSWQWRERGIDPPNYPSNKTVLENIAEDILVQKPLKIRSCDLPGFPRSTFLMVFSPDGTKVASTHGNHNVYVSELASGKHVRILKGHPRTPWCIAFHPSHPQLIGSGCLGGQVRVWDISSGCSEVWNVRKETVIASIAFHPRDQLLVIATYNELYFWDWSQPAPFTRVCTSNVNEKVRYVAFDTLGYKLITGISLCTNMSALHSSILQQTIDPLGSVSNLGASRREDDDNMMPAAVVRPQENNGSAQDMIVNSYQNLVQRYDSLVRNYQRLFMVRHRLTNTPPPPNTIDRGTDPMETDVSPGTSGWTRRNRPSTLALSDDGNSEPGPSRQQDGDESGDGEGSSSRLLNLDVLSFDSGPSSNLVDDSPNREHSIFGSSPSAFQPLTEGRSFRTVDQNERSTRLLPNPFSSSNSSRSDRSTVIRYVRSQQSTDTSENSSRTSIFTSSRQETSPLRSFLQRRRSSSPTQNSLNASQIRNMLFPEGRNTSNLEANASPSTTSQPATTNSSTQMSPMASNVDAQAINESLDLIRDILRDSGTRLLNLITNMSLSTLYNVQRARRGDGSRAHSDDNEGDPPGSSRAHLFHTSVRDDFLSTSSDSDSDQSLEVNILRTRNSNFEQGEQNAPSSDRQPTDRMVFVLNDESPSEGTSRDTGGINVSLSNSRFRVRTQSNSGVEEADPSNPATSTPIQINSGGEEAGPSNPATSTPNPSNRQGGESSNDNQPQSPFSTFNPNRPSTSRDGWPRNVISSEEAYRKVRLGVNALQKLTVQLTNLWLRGNRITLCELRYMWENLRRRILVLHREMPRQNMPPLPSIYTRSLLERCMILTQMTDNAARTINRSSRNGTGTSTDQDRRTEESRETDTERSSNSNLNESEPNSSTNNVNDNRPSSAGQSPRPRSSSTNRASSSARRRLQSRWRPADEMRRRLRMARNRPRGDRREMARALEVSATRHEVRMRAMQVLSTMFNIMMMCLEERGLSQLIITMLRTLKKALALTCLMLMMNRNTGRPTADNPPSSDPDVDHLNVVRIQNSEHAGPVDVDGPDDPAPSSTSSPRPNQGEESQRQNSNRRELRVLICRCKELKRQKDAKKRPAPTTSTASTSTNPLYSPSPSSSSTQRWSNRLAIQIAAANRNTSVTARNRRDLYLERKRQKALHRTNPIAHPLIRKRVLPPVSTHRIPALRSLPSRINFSGLTTPQRGSRSDEPVAGPSTAPPDNPNRESPRNEVMNEFEQRVNLIRLAHLQAVRLRNAARTRYRRLQTIRLYTPSSVREMFELQSNNSDSPTENRSGGQNNSELENLESEENRRVTIRPHILTRSDARGRPSEEPGHFHTVLNNVAVPLMQVNDLPASSNSENPGNQPPRMPRIHEYLQPIILAQNAMVIDDEANEGGGGGVAGGGARRLNAGMAGLLDAGIISETLPAASHRVQAWDFTTGDAPDIADSTKNVVVQRCRIHNDASIDISKDGRLLVALLPVPRLRNTNHWLGVYSLEWARLGQCLHTAVLEQSAVSVALSPTARHLAVGLGSRRFTSTPHARSNVFALLYRLEPLESSSRTGLSPIKELEQNWEHSFTSLNCLRWAPQPGQGLVYANNAGQLIVMS